MSMDDEIIGHGDRWWFFDHWSKMKTGPFKSKQHAINYLLKRYKDLTKEIDDLDARCRELQKQNNVLDKVLHRQGKHIEAQQEMQDEQSQ